MSPRVAVSEIVEGLEMQSDEMKSFLHRPTGRVVRISDEAFRAAEDGDAHGEWIGPEELEDACRLLEGDDQYLALPDRFEIDEYHMMEGFARRLSDATQRDAALTALRGRGAFRYFKDTVHRLGLAKSWYAYRDERYREVARAWCETNDIEYDDSEGLAGREADLHR